MKTNYALIEEKLVKYIQKKVGEKKVLIGLSGGIDSSIVTALAIKALGPKKVKALLVTNSRYSKKGLSIAEEYAKNNKIELQKVSTEEIRQHTANNLKMSPKDIILNSTLDARICDLIIKEVASIEDRIYLGTINGSERLTGRYPKGNLVGDFCPIGGLLKTQIKELAMYMGLGKLVETISESADRICSGCGELKEFKDISYDLLDKILLLFETTPHDKLITVLENKKIPKAKYQKVLARIKKVNHKNDVFPGFYKLNKMQNDG